MNTTEIKTAISKLSTVDAKDAADIVGLLALSFPQSEPVSDALIDAMLAIEAHIDAAKATDEAEAYHGSKDHKADLRDEARSFGA